MNMEDAMTISAMGMRAQGFKIRIVAENIANSGTAADAPGEEPYRRQIVKFDQEMNRAMGLNVVKAEETLPDQSNFERRYEPGHPAANEEGYVLYPNVDSLIEAQDMQQAQRSYQANLGNITMTRNLLQQTVDLLR